LNSVNQFQNHFQLLKLLKTLFAKQKLPIVKLFCKLDALSTEQPAAIATLDFIAIKLLTAIAAVFPVVGILAHLSISIIARFKYNAWLNVVCWVFHLIRSLKFGYEYASKPPN